jgi:DNA-binding MarR family transcriptional regulator
MSGDRRLAENLLAARRAMARDTLASVMGALGVGDLTLIQMGTLMLLDAPGEPMTVKELAGHLDRSVAAVSRMIDQLVQRELVLRREDEQDRRARRLSLSAAGQALLGQVMSRRAEAQKALMAYLDASEREQVMRGMELLAEAARRREDERRASSVQRREPPAEPASAPAEGPRRTSGARSPRRR